MYGKVIYGENYILQVNKISEASNWEVRNERLFLRAYRATNIVSKEGNVERSVVTDIRQWYNLPTVRKCLLLSEFIYYYLFFVVLNNSSVAERSKKKRRGCLHISLNCFRRQASHSYMVPLPLYSI